MDYGSLFVRPTCEVHLQRRCWRKVEIGVRPLCFHFIFSLFMDVLSDRRGFYRLLEEPDRNELEEEIRKIAFGNPLQYSTTRASTFAKLFAFNECLLLDLVGTLLPSAIDAIIILYLMESIDCFGRQAFYVPVPITTHPTRFYDCFRVFDYCTDLIWTAKHGLTANFMEIVVEYFKDDGHLNEPKLRGIWPVGKIAFRCKKPFQRAAFWKLSSNSFILTQRTKRKTIY